MDNGKLYNALLKEQERLRLESQQAGEAKAEEGFRKERPFAGHQHWTNAPKDTPDLPPTVYDPSVSLTQIANPRPLSRDQLRDRKIIYPGMPNKAILDAYREVRIQLRKKAGDKNFAVMVSSLGRNDSSCLTAFNLAVAFSLDAQTAALLVDCNPHGSDLEQLVSAHLSYGVTDYVADKNLKISDILYPSGIDRLSVIPSGTQASSAVELFSASRMRELMSELHDRYPDRCIIVNAPPFRESTESRILANYSDQVVFSVPFGQVTGDVVMECVEILGSDKFSGLVFQE
ncbi:MAG: CpsD/CapB family tyrosine-protein kinase [Marinobacter sp.]|nr:CpsD/CapB family tyrosine-protein kinase [Marinobacter sp.]